MPEKSEPKLFDSATYEAEPETIHPIIEVFGKQPGDFFNDTSRLVEIIMLEHVPYTFSPIWRDDALFKSENYGEGDYEYTTWRQSDVYSSRYRGYLVGFPNINHPDGSTETCLHYWGNNSDIDLESLAVPLTAIRSLFVFSKTRTELAIELDELSAGTSDAKYEIPLLRHKKSGVTFFRPAGETDVQQAIEEFDNFDPPLLVYGDGSGRSSFKTPFSNQTRIKLDL